jgi:short-subunit dehydrogenase involved in D-alanine esterification of teichoic acids
MLGIDLFAGKRFLITGEGTCLSRIMMERFVELGADCVICGRRGSVPEETARSGPAVRSTGWSTMLPGTSSPRPGT